MVVLAAVLLLCVGDAAAQQFGAHGDLAGRIEGVSLFSRVGLQAPGLSLEPRQTMFGQRAIEDDEPKKPDDDDDDPDEPASPADMGLVAEDAGDVSAVKAMLMSAALPGLGQIYAGSNTGYLYMGVEAVSWIGWASKRSGSDNKEGEMFEFADRNFSIDLFERNCVSQRGQTCADAAAQVRDFFANDTAEYYEIISKNTIYKSGWGLIAFDNTAPPEVIESEEYREWIADLSQAQDTDFIEYNKVRDERNDLSRTARSMTVIVLLNHVVSAWHAFVAAGGLDRDLPGSGEDWRFKIDVDASFNDPGAKFIMKRKW